jgi:hypothetical protein
MKCSSCGAESKNTVGNCEYCGASLTSVAGSTQHHQQVQPAAHQVPTDSPDIVAMVKELPHSYQQLFQLPNQSFNFWAFLFPIGFMTGYGDRDAGIRAGLMILAPSVAAFILGLVSWRLMLAVHSVSAIFIFVLHIMFGLKISSISTKTQPFNMGTAILFEFLFIVIGSFIAYL